MLSIRTLHGPRVNFKQFVGLSYAATANRQISHLFTSEFGLLRTTRRGGWGCNASIKVSTLYLLAHIGLVTRLASTSYGGSGGF